MNRNISIKLFVCLIVAVLILIAINPISLIQCTKSWLIGKGIGPNTITPFLSLITIGITFFFAWAVFRLSKVQYASNIMLNFQNHWNEEEARKKRGYIKEGKCDQILKEAINDAWQLDIDYKTISIGKLINLLKAKTGDSTIFYETMRKNINIDGKDYIPLDLISDLLLSYDYLAVHISNRQPSIYEDFMKKYGQTLEEYGHILQVLIVLNIRLADNDKENYKIDFMNLMASVNLADRDLVKLCIREIEEKHNRGKYKHIDLTLLKKWDKKQQHITTTCS